jgi:hypothetical protein
MLIFFSLFFAAIIKIFKIKPFFIPIWQSRRKNQHTFFYVYIAARSRIQQEHYLIILCSTIQEDARTLFFLYNVAETNQEIKKIKKQ